MRIFPSIKDEWFALFLFPFKAYIIVVIPFYYVFRIFCPTPFIGTGVSDGTSSAFLSIFIVCVLAIFGGFLIQWFVSGWERARVSMLFVVIPVVLLFLFRFL